MIIKTLNDNEYVNKIYFINRPVSLYERVLTKNKWQKKSGLLSYLSKIELIDTTSFDLIGPLKKRIWTKHCYKRIVNNLLKICNNSYRYNKINILLDFTPIANIPYHEFKLKGFIIWYDVIDNFTKHNRYSLKERIAVKEKYIMVDKFADIITGVTSKALDEFPSNKNKYVMNNGVIDNLESELDLKKRNIKFREINEYKNNKKYLFGYIGFISDKFDIEFVKKLTNIGDIVIYGDFYDKKVKKEISKCNRIILKGSYKNDNLIDIMDSFKIGIIPYKEEKSHDGSPLKLYQYLQYGKPVISTMVYEDQIINCEYVLVTKNIEEILNFVNKIKDSIKPFEIRKCFKEDYLWSKKLNDVIKLIIEKNNIGSSDIFMGTRVKV